MRGRRRLGGALELAWDDDADEVVATIVSGEPVLPWVCRRSGLAAVEEELDEARRERWADGADWTLDGRFPAGGPAAGPWAW